MRDLVAQIILIPSEKLASGSTHLCPTVDMFLSSACIPLLLYGLKASLAAAAVPPMSLGDFSLAAAPFQLPDNSTLSSNLNVTQQQQESPQLLYSNYTLAAYVEIPEASR